jgi:hypothetical protein
LALIELDTSVLEERIEELVVAANDRVDEDRAHDIAVDAINDYDFTHIVRDAISNEGLDEWSIDNKIERALEDYVRADDSDFVTEDTVRDLIAENANDALKNDLGDLEARVDTLEQGGLYMMGEVPLDRAFNALVERVGRLEEATTAYDPSELARRLDALEEQQDQDALLDRIEALNRRLTAQEEATRGPLNAFALVGKVVQALLNTR